MKVHYGGLFLWKNNLKEVMKWDLILKNNFQIQFVD